MPPLLPLRRRSANEGLSPTVLAQLKEATVFVKVGAGRYKFSGSGFLLKASGSDGYVVTNNHVIDPSVSIDSRSGNSTRHVTITVSNPRLDVVFRSGQQGEQSVKATVVAADKKRDLAVLKVAGVEKMPAPLELGSTTPPNETSVVYVVGFPFGQALALDKRNPAPTVGKGTVSSLRAGRQRPAQSGANRWGAQPRQQWRSRG